MRKIENPDHGDKRQIATLTCQQTEEGSSFSGGTDFPEDLVERIFSLIPFPQVYKVRALSKHWCSKYTPSRDSESLHLYPLGKITACQNWPSYVSVFRIRHKLIRVREPRESSAQTTSRHQPLHRRVSHIDLLAFDWRANSWKPFAFHPRLSQIFRTQSFELGVLSPKVYWRTSSWGIGGSLVAVFIPSSSRRRLLVTNWLTGDSERVSAPEIDVENWIFSTLPRPETKVIPVGSKDYEVFQLDSQWQMSADPEISTLCLVCHHYDSCRKTWSSKSVVASSDIPGQEWDIAGDGTMPYLFPNWVRLGDTIYVLIYQDEGIFIASWDLNTGTLETNLLPLEYEDELQLLKAGIFLVASKFVVVALFEGGGEPESASSFYSDLEDSEVPVGSELSASELRFYDYKPEGCYFAEVYRTEGQGIVRYGKDLVADSECIHFVTLSYNIRGVHLTISSFNVVEQTFQQGPEVPWTGEEVRTCSSCFQPGLNPFAVP